MNAAPPVFDPLDPDQMADLLGTYRALRARAPVQKTPIAGGTWFLTRYEDMRGLLRETDALINPPGRATSNKEP